MRGKGGNGGGGRVAQTPIFHIPAIHFYLLPEEKATPKLMKTIATHTKILNKFAMLKV